MLPPAGPEASVELITTQTSHLLFFTLQNYIMCPSWCHSRSNSSMIRHQQTPSTRASSTEWGRLSEPKVRMRRRRRHVNHDVVIISHELTSPHLLFRRWSSSWSPVIDALVVRWFEVVVLCEWWRCCCVFRTEGDLSRSDRHRAETRIQPGHPLLCHDVTEELVQRWACSTSSSWDRIIQTSFSSCFLSYTKVMTLTKPLTPSSLACLERLPEPPVCLETLPWTSSRPGCRLVEFHPTPREVDAGLQWQTRMYVCCLTGSRVAQVQEHDGLRRQDHEARGTDGVSSRSTCDNTEQYESSQFVVHVPPFGSNCVCPSQVLQRYRAPAGSSVFGRGHRLHHLWGGREGSQRCVEDGLKWRRCAAQAGVFGPTPSTL